MKGNIKLMLTALFLPLFVFFFTTSTIASSRLKVNCDREGAEVFLDEKFKGECPVEFEVSAGKHKVVLRKDLDDGSYYYYERETRVGEDVIQEINAQLERIFTEQYYWNQAEKNGTIESYKEYLKAYPEGKFANEAKMKIENLKMKKEKLVLLRSEPLTVSGVDEYRRPLEYIQNDFEDRGDVVIDHATGLIWQKSGSDRWLDYKKAHTYIAKLNRERFAGYDDWRLPTIPELMSLLEEKIQSNRLYINPIFDAKQGGCWSADLHSSDAAWHVNFRNGGVYWGLIHHESYVRAVRSSQD